MSNLTALADMIDTKNKQWISATKRRLADLSVFSETQLEWLSMEHYQFSAANKGFLERAIEATRDLCDPGVAIELTRNLHEEDGHAPMYKRGMLEVGTDFDQRIEFRPTTDFLATLERLSSHAGSRALGTLYATETAAIFEHEVFFDICREICHRRNAPWEGTTIKAFHDLHLSGGVEQSHKDGLSVFLAARTPPTGSPLRPLDEDEICEGAIAAIDAMKHWWSLLIDEVEHPQPVWKTTELSTRTWDAPA
ncbi:MAG: hypothetical protein H6729_16940 [Deltaproteobacteria bacterium]|nr:hypothetical protein [Deltaproteobacteria bacterium]